MYVGCTPWGGVDLRTFHSTTGDKTTLLHLFLSFGSMYYATAFLCM